MLYKPNGPANLFLFFSCVCSFSSSTNQNCRFLSDSEVFTISWNFWSRYNASLCLARLPLFCSLCALLIFLMRILLSFTCFCNLVDGRKRRKRTGSSLVMSKKRRKLLPFNPSEDPARKLEQMASLATALTATGTEFSNELTYIPGMAPRSANRAKHEREGMQVGWFSSSSTILVN